MRGEGTIAERVSGRGESGGGGTVADLMDRVGLSATGGDSKKSLDEVLASYSAMGYRYFEAWLKGRGSAMDVADGPEFYVEKGREYGMGFCSLHMRDLETADQEAIDRAVEEALFAEKIGASARFMWMPRGRFWMLSTATM